MDPELEKTPQKTSGPSLIERLAWWFGIYIAAQIPLIAYAFKQQDVNAIGDSIFGPFYFPLLLGYVLAPFANLLPDNFATFTVPCLSVAGYAFYFWHLIQTIRAKERRRLDLLLLLLVTVVFLNEFIIASQAASIQN